MNAEPLHSSSGSFLGYRLGDSLFTSTGKKIGRFIQDEVFDRHGKYRGEVRLGRLSRNVHKKMKRAESFMPSRDLPRPRLPRMVQLPIPPNFHHFYPE